MKWDEERGKDYIKNESVREREIEAYDTFRMTWRGQGPEKSVYLECV